MLPHLLPTAIEKEINREKDSLGFIFISDFSFDELDPVHTAPPRPGIGGGGVGSFVYRQHSPDV